MEDGVFKYREPPKVTWCLDYGDDRPGNVIVTAKGLTPDLSVTSIACIHTDFKSKII